MGPVVENPEIVVQKVQGSLRRLGTSGHGILLAVSGGGDSMALLDVVAGVADALKLRVEVATVDHGLRSESRDEAVAVQRACAERGLLHHLEAAEVTPGAGVEARARRVRYAALEAVRVRAGLDFIATAHTATDQAETVLMRLARGAALGGAAGVLERRGVVLRPMLACTREEVRAYLTVRGISFAEDPMNEDPAFLRTRVRQRVLPVLEEAAGPGAIARVARFAEFAAEDDRLLGEQAEAALRRIRGPAQNAGDEGAVDSVALGALPRAIRRRVIALLLVESGLPIDADLVEQVDAAVRGDAEVVTLALRAELRVAGGWLRIVRARVEEARAPSAIAREDDALTLDGPEVSLVAAGVRLRWRSRPLPSHERDGVTLQPVHGPVRSPVRVRFRRPGDRVRLPGGHSRKLQDVLVDARVPRERRDRVPLVVDADGNIVCVVGVLPRPGPLLGASDPRPEGEADDVTFIETSSA